MSKLSPNGAALSPNSNFQSPAALVEAARELLGGTINLDPASCASANARVLATVWHGPGEDSLLHGVQDGLSVDWYGRIFLNPPGRLFAPFWRKLLEEYAAERVSAAVFVCFSIDALQTTQNHNEGGLLAFPTFIPNRRIAYLDPETGEPAKSFNKKTGKWSVSPPKPSAIVWLPSAADRESACMNGDAPEDIADGLRVKLSTTMLRHGYGGISVGG